METTGYRPGTILTTFGTVTSIMATGTTLKTTTNGLGLFGVLT